MEGVPASQPGGRDRVRDRAGARVNTVADTEVAASGTARFTGRVVQWRGC